MQKPADIQEYDQAAFKLSDAGNVTGFAFGKNRSWRGDFRRRNFEHLRSGADKQAKKFVIEFDDEDSITLVRLDSGAAKAFAKIHDGNDFPAEVDDPFDDIRGVGYRSDLRDADDFAHGGYANPVGFVTDAKTNDLKIFLHERSPCQERPTSASSYS